MCLRPPEQEVRTKDSAASLHSEGSPHRPAEREVAPGFAWAGRGRGKRLPDEHGLSGFGDDDFVSVLHRLESAESSALLRKCADLDIRAEASKRASVEILAGRRAASSRRDSSGVVEHFSLSRNRRRQGCLHMGGANIEVAGRPSDHVRSRAHIP